ncbi:uncharacterized protein FIBRA_05825 [Fibroporia radiculosa]|uniref:YTH domain-containing protein n=1 Tax=Fibroporia radiculosa TaxID=599839 RepID=J4IAX7_9APHY|nr:uncharacterized protein FIBRA_05825 [Fibroporia radiculosa]CCM03681.1 predicted protein [Fibroporia radiculosa]
MADSRSSASSDSASRARSLSQSTNPSRRPRIPFQAPPHPSPLYHPSNPFDTTPSPSAPSPTFQPLPPSYQANSLPYGHRSGFIGQYTMSPQPQVNMPQYAYPHHPGLHALDTNMHPPQNQLIGYSPNSLIPIIHPHSPVYQGYPGHSDGNTSAHSFSANPAFAAHSHPHSPAAHPSPPPRSPLSHQQPSGAHTHAAAYAGQAPYSPLRYSTPPFVYPPHSFAHSPSMYPSQYPSPYAPHSYTPEASQDGQGTWWYVPPPTRPASSQYDSYQHSYQLSYNMPSRDIDSYSQPGQSSTQSHLFPMSPRPNQGQHPSSQSAPPSAPPPLPSPGSPPSTASLVVRQNPKEATPSNSSRSVADPQRNSRRVQHQLNSPAQRSEWVMWIGNVPSDASHDELWRFLNQLPSPSAASPASSNAEDPWGGVLSIFLISRSNCAFVNLQSEAHLQSAIRHFNGKPLRPGDPRCPRLVCRLRGREDDVKAGVGGQRGVGLHVGWIRDQREKARAQPVAKQDDLRSPAGTASSEHVTTPSSSTSEVAPALSLNLSSDDESGRRRHRFRRPAPHSSSSGSYASTNSSILTQYFPKRYFILKSLTQKDLDISVEKGLWATQRHNETTLDQAFRTSKDVYLIFGVNKSGEFYGYAKMIGPVLRGEHRVSWASRTDSPPRRTPRSSQGSSPPVTRRDRDPHPFFSPTEHRYEESPQPFSPDRPLSFSTSPSPSRAKQPTMLPSPVQSAGASAPHATAEGQQDAPIALSAPPEMHQPHRQLSRPTIPMLRPAQSTLGGQKVTPQSHSLSVPQPSIELDPTAPFRHRRDHSAPPESTAAETAPAEVDWDAVPEAPLHTVTEEEERPGSGRDASPRVDGGEVRGDGEEAREGPSWGEPFQVQWIRTERLPFFRTRHLRNPWNHDREVKVSRDGTELEPTVGQALLDEWDRPAPPLTPATERRLGSRTPAQDGAGLVTPMMERAEGE